MPNTPPNPASPPSAGGQPAVAAPAAAPPNTVQAGFNPSPPATRLFLIAVLVLATGSMFLVGHVAGAGLALLAFGLTAATSYAVVARSRDLEPAARRERRRFAAGCLAAAALLALTPAVRAAGWVFVPALLAALLLTSIAAASPKTWRELGVGALAWTIQVIPGPALVAASTAKELAGRRWARLAPVARGVALATILVVGFGALFASADAAFNELLDGLITWDLNPDELPQRLLVFGMVVALAGALWLIAATSKPRPSKPAARTLGPAEWRIALSALVALFAAFVALQLTTLFGGDSHVLRTAGLTYAEYAREGFGQLLLLATLTLAVVAAAARYGPTSDRPTRLLTGALCLLTIVVLVSAIYRLGLYETAFGATRLRLLAHDWLLYLGALFALLIGVGATGQTRVLPRAVVGLSAVAVLAFVASNPDGRIADRNVERWADTGELDTDYLAGLSADAAPSLAGLKPAVAACAARQLSFAIDEEPSGLVGLNVSRSRARDQLIALGAGRPAQWTIRGVRFNHSAGYESLDCSRAKLVRP